MMKFTALLMTVLAATFVMAADEAKDAKADKGATAGEHKAGAQHSLEGLKFLEGAWNVEQRMEPAYSHKGQEARGRFEMHRELNGNALIGHFEARAGDAADLKSFEGHLVVASAHSKHQKHGKRNKEERAGDVKADDKGAKVEKSGKSKFVAFWADSEGNALLTHNVSFENNKFTATFDKHGEHPKSRVVFEKTGEGKVSYVMEHETDKGWEKVATATYTRAEDKARDVKHDQPKQR